MGQTTFTGPVVSQNGFIENSFTTAQLLALPNPTEGLLVYNTTLNEYQVYNGSSFQPAFGPAAPIPVVNSVSPPSISTSGGSFDIFGSNFTGATAVTLGGTPAASFFVANDGFIQCNSGSHPAGTVSVNVTTPAGTNGPNNLLTYVAAALPVISNVDPAGGTVFGGPCNVTITGSNFTGTTNVTVDGSACSYNLINDSTITVTQLPPGPSGAVGVYVTNAGGTSTPYVWQYYQTPRITGISPSSGSSAGGTSVTVTGYALTNMSECQFYGATETTNASGISPTNDNQATFNTPAHAAEITQLRGFNSTYGYGNYSDPIYTYTAPPPTITGLNTNGGSTVGGATAINMFGTGFTGATSVTFQGNPASFNVYGDGFLQVTNIPAGTVGSGNIVVTNTAGSSSPWTTWNYVNAPVITGCSPSSGGIAGGTSVTVEGYGFNNSTPGSDAMRLYNSSFSYPTIATRANDLECTFTTLSYPTAEPVRVAAQSTTSGGFGPDSSLGVFTYTSPSQVFYAGVNYTNATLANGDTQFNVFGSDASVIAAFDNGAATGKTLRLIGGGGSNDVTVTVTTSTVIGGAIAIISISPTYGGSNFSIDNMTLS